MDEKYAVSSGHCNISTASRKPHGFTAENAKSAEEENNSKKISATSAVSAVKQLRRVCNLLLRGWLHTRACSSLHVLLILSVVFIGACHDTGTRVTSNEPAEAPVSAAPSVSAPAPAKAEQPSEIELFDGKTLGNWKITDFGGQGDVYVKDGAIYLETGNDMTGVTWDGPVVRTNYEITLEAMRVSGSDFFCGFTFPVKDKCCSLILGGWGGSLCGLSNIDYYDAANNETTRFVSFENGKWYHVRLRVTPNRIQAWLQEEGEEPLVDMDITDRKIDTRAEMDLCHPMGVATWQTAGAVRNIRLRKLAE